MNIRHDWVALKIAGGECGERNASQPEVIRSTGLLHCLDWEHPVPEMVGPTVFPPEDLKGSEALLR